MLSGTVYDIRRQVISLSQSLSRDVRLLLKIIKYTQFISRCMKRHRCSNFDSFIKDEECPPLCSWALTRIVEATIHLTPGTRSSIPALAQSDLKEFRNILVHDYEAANKQKMYVTMLNLCTSRTTNQIKERIKYCNENKR